MGSSIREVDSYNGLSQMTYQHKVTKEKIKLTKTGGGDYVTEDKTKFTINELRKNYKYLKSESKLVRFNNTVLFQK